MEMIKEKKLSEIFDKRIKEVDIRKYEIAHLMDVHPNTIKARAKNPLTFTLKELLILKDIFKVQTIDEIFFLL